MAVISPCQFFGEVALIQSVNRTANVIAMEKVMCLVLNKSDFNKHLKHLKVSAPLLFKEHYIYCRNHMTINTFSSTYFQKVKMSESQAAKYRDSAMAMAKDKNILKLQEKRRVSGFDFSRKLDHDRVARLYKLIVKVT